MNFYKRKKLEKILLNFKTLSSILWRICNYATIAQDSFLWAFFKRPGYNATSLGTSSTQLSKEGVPVGSNGHFGGISDVS